MDGKSRERLICLRHRQLPVTLFSSDKWNSEGNLLRRRQLCVLSSANSSDLFHSTKELPHNFLKQSSGDQCFIVTFSSKMYRGNTLGEKADKFVCRNSPFCLRIFCFLVEQDYHVFTPITLFPIVKDCSFYQKRSCRRTTDIGDSKVFPSQAGKTVDIQVGEREEGCKEKDFL